MKRTEYRSTNGITCEQCDMVWDYCQCHIVWIKNGKVTK